MQRAFGKTNDRKSEMYPHPFTHPDAEREFLNDTDTAPYRRCSDAR